MRSQTLLLSLLCLAWIGAVLLAGCTAPAGKPTPTPAPIPVMTPTPQQPPAEGATYTQADNGATYEVSQGELVELRLAENPTTGYRWNLSLTSGLSLVTDRYIPDDPTGQLVGSGGTHVWFIEAVGTGEQGVSAFYARPWEPAGTGGASFTLTLVISGGESCSGGGEVCTIPTTAVTVPPRYHVYTMADNGKTVREPLGETLGIRLQANPSTGYSWNLSLTKGLSLTGDEYIPDAGAPRVGVGGVQSYTLVTKAKGDQLAHAEYRRPWIASGTVTYVALEGGFYGILGDDGKKYDPLDLDPKYQKDGLRVAFEATPVEGQAGIHMWGTMVNLDFIEEIPVFSLKVTVT